MSVALRTPRALLLLPLALLASAAVLGADDFWLVPNAFRVAEGAVVELRGQTSSAFPTSKSAVAVERVAEAKRIGGAGEVPITGLSVQGRSLMLRDRPAAPGQYAVAVAIRPRSMRESVDGFRRYLQLEGAAAALERVEREGLLGGRDSVTRRYAKYAKALVQVGDAGPRAFDRAAGHVLEFVPLSDPAAVRRGDTLALRLLYRGRPLAGVVVHADATDLDADRDAVNAAAHPAGAAGGYSTDAEGVVRIPVTRTGMWNARTIHVVKAAENSGADWDTHWATLVFEIGSP